jgi:SnoaL-like protein
MTDLKSTVDDYIAAWNQTDADARLAAVARLWTDDGGYTDPLASVRGHDGVAAVIDGAQKLFPGHVFRLLGTPETHHGIARFQWELVPAAGGEAVAIGADTVVLTEDGKLRDVFGFLDKAPAM